MKVNLNKKGGNSKNWIQEAVNPKHKGYCTPMTKSTCTPKRKAFAETMKKNHGFHKDGGSIEFVNNLIEKFQNGKKLLVALPKTDPNVESHSTGVTDFNGYHFQKNKILTFEDNGLPLLKRILQPTPYINREINAYSTQPADTTYTGVGLNGQNFQYTNKGNPKEFKAVNSLFNRLLPVKH